MYTMNQEGNALVYRWDGEVLSIMPWGENSLCAASSDRNRGGYPCGGVYRADYQRENHG